MASPIPTSPRSPLQALLDAKKQALSTPSGKLADKVSNFTMAPVRFTSELVIKATSAKSLLARVVLVPLAYLGNLVGGAVSLALLAISVAVYLCAAIGFLLSTHFIDGLATVGAGTLGVFILTLTTLVVTFVPWTANGLQSHTLRLAQAGSANAVPTQEAT